LDAQILVIALVEGTDIYTSSSQPQISNTRMALMRVSATGSPAFLVAITMMMEIGICVVKGEYW
jgi:hypothetical protein